MILIHFFDWLLLFPIVVSFGLMLYALSRRGVVGAGPFALTMAGWFLWASGYLFELNVTSLPSKIFWDNLQFFGIDLAVAGALLFALVYSGQIIHLRPALLLLSLFPLLNLALVWSNQRHQLVRSNAELQTLGTQVHLIYDYGPWFWASLAYTYLLIGITLSILVRFAMRNRLHRISVFTFVLGMSAPTLGGLITVAGLVPIVGAERLDISPLTFAISGPLMAWGLFRKRGLFDLGPIARSLLIDQMLDGTLVSDQFGRIVDANPQAHVLLRYAPGTLPGQRLVDLAPLIAALTATLSTAMANYGLRVRSSLCWMSRFRRSRALVRASLAGWWCYGIVLSARP
jgi:PAS domain-containing protein